MKERLNPPKRGERIRRGVAISTLSALAALGIGSISGCSEQESISWKLAVDCPAGKELTARNYKSSGSVKTFEMSCGKNGAPSSTQIIDSPRSKNGEKNPNGIAVDISATHNTGDTLYSTPILTTDNDDNKGFTEVRISDVMSLDRVNITQSEARPKGQN